MLRTVALKGVFKVLLRQAEIGSTPLQDTDRHELLIFKFVSGLLPFLPRRKSNELFRGLVRAAFAWERALLLEDADNLFTMPRPNCGYAESV